MKNKRKLFKTLDIVVGTATFSSLFLLLNATGVYADSSVVDEVTITVPVSCSITGTVGTAHTAMVDVGTYEDEIGETTFNVLCNDANGFAVYAIGYSDDTYGNTTMKPSTLPASNGIVTGTATSGGTSNWAMKLTAVSGDYTPTLATGFNAYHAIPEEYTRVASLASNTDAVSGSSFKSTYAVYISQAQAADTYTGKVKYTVVHPASAATPDWRTYMQNLDPSQCTSNPTTVYDNRDGHAYIIQRLLDGKCWMMENLDLGRTDLTTDLTSSNTNLSTTITAATFNGWKKTSGTGTYNAGEFMLLTSSNTTDGLDTDPTSGTPYGTLYNYYAASAGTISGDDNSNDAQYDICPAGWRLPTGGSSGEFKTLYDKYNSSASMRASIADGGAAFALAGWFWKGSPTRQGVNASYWSSTNDGSEEMSTLYFTNNPSVNPGSSDERDNGQSIRCVLSRPMSITQYVYLQDFKDITAGELAAVINSMEDNTTYNLIDNRDNKAYKVAKMKDNTIWMAENLDLGRTDLTIDLTSANTNLATTITATTFNSWKKTSGSGNYYNGEFIPLTSSNTVNGLDTDPTSGTPYGTLYNYYAASAGTISGNANNSSAQYDICPAGWHLPTSNEFYSLYREYSSSSIIRAPIINGGAAFALAGYFLNGSPDTQELSGNYWSSTYKDGTQMFDLFIVTSDVLPNATRIRQYGQSIRCVAK